VTMREPYETLLGKYRDHPLMGRFLDGYEPDFVGIAASEVPLMISSSELVMWNIALAFHNGDRTARFADLLALDYDNRIRVADAITIAAGMLR